MKNLHDSIEVSSADVGSGAVTFAGNNYLSRESGTRGQKQRLGNVRQRSSDGRRVPFGLLLDSTHYIKDQK